ncbi:MAG: YraN family protein [Gammaproteobacteria bacterium]|nr:YraN family protein [Gammaproteobacteria bacterium]
MDLFSRLANTTTEIGQCAEDAALEFLLAKGMRLVARNYRCKVGEIDLVMQHHGTLIFVEVRYRKQHQFGDGAESVDFRKQQKIIRAAEFFLQQHRQYTQSPCRIDVISISRHAKTSPSQSEIDWIPNAIQA